MVADLKKSTSKLFVGKFTMIILLLVMSVSMHIALAAPPDDPVDACINITTSGTYTMNASILNSADPDKCINISVDDVIFDCAGFTIDGVDGASTDGIYTENENITIKNCIISDFASAGIDISWADNVTLINNTVTSSWSGIRLYFADSFFVDNNTAYDNEYNFFIYTCHNATIINSIAYNGAYGFWSTQNANITAYQNKLYNNSEYGWKLEDDAILYSNLIYNNLFNNTQNIWLPSTSHDMQWNTTNQTGTRIYGHGPYIGGNYYTNSSGTGYSDTCTDSDTDGFCDNPYDPLNGTTCSVGINCSDNTDYLPLSDEYPVPLTYSDNSTNSTIAGETIEHSLKWTGANLTNGGSIFSFCNGTWNGTDCETYFSTNQLQDANTEILEDVWVETNDISNNGDIGVVRTGTTGTNNMSSFIKVSNPLNSNETVVNASLCFFVNSNGYDAGENITTWIYGVANQTWIETGPYGNYSTGTHPSIGSLIDTNTEFNGTDDDFWLCFNVTNWVSTEVQADHSNISFYWNSTFEYHDGDDHMNAYSKEGAVVSTRLYLNITSIGGGWINDTYVAFNDSHCNVDYTECWSNVTKTITTDVGVNVSWKVWANDTDGNSNQSETFTYVTIEPPVFSVYSTSPANQTATDDTTPDFTFNVSGTESTYNCILYVGGVNKGSNATTDNNTATTITSSVLSDGTYNWYVSCSSGVRTNTSETRQITIDLIPNFNELIEAGNPNENAFGTDTSSHYYRNGTWQTENSINITINITNTSTPVYVEWKNETVWANHTMTSSGDIHTINISSQADYGYYTFNIWANDSLGTMRNIYNWTFYDYESGWGDKEDWRKYVGLNAVAEEFSYEQFYLYGATYSADQVDDRVSPHEQATDGTLTDTGLAYYTQPTVSQETWCGGFVGHSIDDTIKMNDTVIENMYVRIFWDTIPNDIYIAYEKENHTEFDPDYDEQYLIDSSTAKMNVTLPGFQQSVYHLNAFFWNLTNDPTYEDNEINLFTFKGIQTGSSNVPSFVSFVNSTHKYVSFFILNLPDNTTLNATDTDSDGLSDYDELFEHWTDPKDDDTDGGGESDYSETENGRNPLDGYDDVVDSTPPAVSAYYQWNSTNDTVDFGTWTEGFVSINWNLTDATGINTSTCQIKVRNKNSVTNYTNHSYIDDLTHPDYDPVTGYKNLTCYTEDLGGGITRVSANMTRSYDWRPLNTAFEQDNAAHDNIYYSFGGRSTKIVFHNITNTINTTFIFLADIDNQSATVADHLFYSCNLSYTNGDYTTDPNCAFVGAGTTNATRDVNFGYVIGALTTDENGTFGGVVHTETMYGISYCPDCTNTNNAWITYSTDGYDGHSETSANQGTTWSALSGEEFNVILHVIDNIQLEFNLTIDDTPGNTLSDLQIDTYGALANLAPYGDIMTDNVTGSLVSYYDIHGIIETGTIWINTTIADPNEDSMNCSVYLLNNDSSVNQTLLANYSVEGYGICPYEWNTTNFTDGDYRLNVTSTDGLLTGHDESAGYIRIDKTAPTISSVTASSITSNSATITWTTDENANSSLSISPAGTYSNSASYTTPHSIAVTGLSAETNYTYNVTSCDPVDYCTTSSSQEFTTLTADSGGGGGGCTPSWICTDWSLCVDGTQTRTCEDENKCDDNSSMPDLSQACTIAPPTTPLNKTNFTIADMGNYTWPFSPDDEGLYHPTRFAAVVSSLMAGNLGAMMMNIVASFGDYYYRPSFGWGLLSILFMHITPFVGLYLLVGLLIRYSKMLSKTSTTFKFVIYFIAIPLFVLLMTLLMPSV